MEITADVLASVLTNLNTWLVMLIVGLVIWAVRQVIPDAVEAHKAWKIVLRLLPIAMGAALALIPGLRPVGDNLAQSAAVGMIGGSFSTTAYEVLRESFGNKVRLALGSKARRTEAGRSTVEPPVGDQP